MYFVGIDSSLASTGLATIQDNQLVAKAVVKTKPAKGAAAEMDRLMDITAKVIRFVRLYASDGGACVALEGAVNFGKGNHLPIVGLNYLIRYSLLGLCDVIVVQPSALKKFAMGKGNAKKDGMRLAAYKRWGFEAETDDEVDAYCLARYAEAVRLGNKELKYDRL